MPGPDLGPGEEWSRFPFSKSLHYNNGAKAVHTLTRSQQEAIRMSYMLCGLKEDDLLENSWVEQLENSL